MSPNDDDPTDAPQGASVESVESVELDSADRSDRSDTERAPEPPVPPVVARLSRLELVAAAVRTWQRALADVGGRNTLLWYRDLPLGTIDLTTAHPGGVSKLLAGRPTTISDLVREPSALAEARSRARSIAATCDLVLAQRGIPVGFLAIGMASWAVGGSRAPAAPVLLRPVVLRPTGTASPDYEIDLGDEVEVNPVLVQALQAQAGIEIDAVALAERAADSGGFDPGPAYAALRQACADLPGFAVTPRLVIGTFPHSKLDMVADLAAQGDSLAAHDVVAALAGDDDAEAGVRAATPDPPVDPDRDPADERLVLDTDSAQGDVVDAVLRGASLAVTAPAGTGATQTVAALVAALAGEGKSSLLVSARRRDLTEVVERLDAVGLADLVLDAVDAGTDRRATLHQVVDTFQAVLDRGEGGGSAVAAVADPRRLTVARDRLRDHVEALHEVREPWGVSVHEAQWAIAELARHSPGPSSRVRLRGGALLDLPRTRLVELSQELTGAARAGAWAGDGTTGDDDPWYGAHILTDDDAEAAHEIVVRLAGGGLDRATTLLDVILEESSLPAAASVDDWERALTTMAGVRATLEVFRPEVFDNPLDEHVTATASSSERRSDGVGLGAWQRSRVRGQARRLLRPGRPPDDLHAELVAARNHRRAWHDLVGAGGRPEISPRLDEALDTCGSLRDDLDWLGERLATTAGGGELATVPLAALGDRLAALAQHTERLMILPQVIPVLEELRDSGMSEIVDDFASRAVGPDQVTPELEHIWWVSLVRHVTESDPRYAGHDGEHLRTAVADYAQADTAQLAATAARVRIDVDRRIRATVTREKADAATLLAEVDGERRPRRVRDLLAESAPLLLATKPCWAVSPYAVAEVVPPGTTFDVVIIDSAGLLAPEEALAAVTRGRQVVVLGDPVGVPPTAFTTTPTGHVGVAAVSAGQDSTEVPSPPPSVFDALHRVLPTRQLTWEYVAHDERLVAAADHAAYGRGLVTFPGSRAASPVRVEQVAGAGFVGAGADAAIETTEAEVSRVVELVVEHVTRRPDQSLAVVGVTARHATRLRDVLDHELGRLRDATPAFFDPAAAEPFAVRSLVDLGTDRWDAVILSVGYGKTPHGRVLHRFTDLLAPGADRLLVSATMRARRQLTLVTALTADDLDPDRMHDPGPAALLSVLVDLTAVAADAQAGSGPARDPLMADLGARLRREGLEVREDVGSGRHPIDLVVTHPRHPGAAPVAVAGDGAGYAAMRSTRDRDRLWEQHLSSLGWRVLRIWSTDLYRDPAREVARVVAASRGTAPAVEPLEGAVETDETSDMSEASEANEASQASQTSGRRGARRAVRGATGGDEEATAVGGSTLDDTDAGWGEQSQAGGHDRWLTEQRPPHWG